MVVVGWALQKANDDEVGTDWSTMVGLWVIAVVVAVAWLLFGRFAVGILLAEAAEAARVAGMFCLGDEFRHLPSLPGKHLSHFLPALVHEQFLQLPVLLHRQQIIL